MIGLWLINDTHCFAMDKQVLFLPYCSGWNDVCFLSTAGNGNDKKIKITCGIQFDGVNFIAPTGFLIFPSPGVERKQITDR